MKRAGFAMQLLPKDDVVKEYRQRHDEIWPEVKKELENAGVCDYSIYLDSKTLTLYASWKLTEHNRVDELASREVIKRWWTWMADLMETNADNSPVVRQLDEMFYMD